MSKRKLRVAFRRKREDKTDYRRRLELLKSGKLRLVVRRSLKNISAQVVEYRPGGDNVLVSAHTNELKKYGWKKARRNTVAAYLVGLLVGLKARKRNISEAILDMGLYRNVKGNLLYATLKGALDAGVKIPCSEDILPSGDRIKGLHLKNVNFDEVKNNIIKGN